MLIGDADLNGVITISDATAVQIHSSESSTLTGDALTAADVDKNGQINIKDATAIQYYLAELTYAGSYCGTYTGGETPTEPETTEPASKDYLYYKNTNNWSTVMAYYWSDSNTKMTTWPGVATESLGNNVYRVEVPSDATFIIFNNGSGGNGNQTTDLTISGMNKIYENGSWSDYNG